uniref:Uncharacterized protein n=1 Tax=Arundo donax TaxID=35708 RepID=A0A0A8YLC4_ARUDO
MALLFSWGKISFFLVSSFLGWFLPRVWEVLCSLSLGISPRKEKGLEIFAVEGFRGEAQKGKR